MKALNNLNSVKINKKYTKNVHVSFLMSRLKFFNVIG